MKKPVMDKLYLNRFIVENFWKELAKVAEFSKEFLAPMVNKIELLKWYGNDGNADNDASHYYDSDDDFHNDDQR